MKAARLADERAGGCIGLGIVQHGLEQFPLDRQPVLGESAGRKIRYIRLARHGEMNIGRRTQAITQARSGPFHARQVGPHDGNSRFGTGRLGYAPCRLQPQITQRRHGSGRL